MNTNAVMAKVDRAAQSYTDLNSLNQVKKLGRERDPEAIREVAKQFESFFISQLMKEMRAGVDSIGKDNFLNSSEMKFHQQMFDQQMSLQVASSGGYGLADILARQLTEQYDINWDEQNSPKEFKQMLADRITSVATGTEAVAESKRETISLNRDNFVERLSAHAEVAADRLGVDKNVLLAQAALETGWGEHVSRDQTGSSNNLFNIKSDQRWSGDSVVVSTLEYRDGVAEREKASFRAYQTIADSFNDYVDFIQQNPRYQQALEKVADSKAYVQELQSAGYATDPNYAQKIISLIGQLAK